MPTAITTSPVTPADRRRSGNGYIWGPQLDGWLLGGASVVAFCVLRLLDLSNEAFGFLATMMLLLAHVVNHPHFAHSYQIFYASRRDMTNGHLSGALAWRWWWAGAIAPFCLAVFLGVAGWRATQGDTVWIAVAINLMGALVGWHYVKQGFGMAMTDAALKRAFWPSTARLAMLVNAYACWAAAWIGLNSTKAGTAYWGLFSLDFKIPVALTVTAWCVCLSTTCWATVTVVRALQTRKAAHPAKPLPYNGLLAYFVTLYLWTVFAWADPAYLLVIPFFHSLQYLTVVWRYKLNEWSEDHAGPPLRRRVTSFLVSGIVLGAMGFWLLPGSIDYVRLGHWPTYAGQPAVAIACAWLFINVHHYLIDNVMWRKGNPKIARHLFGAASRD